MTDLAAFAALVPEDNGLCVVSTLRPDGGVQASVVNAGVLGHPVTEEQVVGLVAMGGSRKLANLIGPDDPNSSIDDEALRQLLQEVFRAAGGTHDDWDAYERVMAEDRRAAVLVSPRRTYANPGAS